MDENMEWWIYILAAVVGVTAGAINTLAGSGSLLMLPMLVFLGLPADVANGTNRVGIAVQCVVGMWTMRRAGRLDLGPHAMKLLVPTLIGSVLGASIAVQLSETVMRVVIGLVLALALIAVVARPEKFLQPITELKPLTIPVLLAFVGIGFYGGFIQAAVGILLLIGLVAGAGYNVVNANGIKLFLTLSYTLVALPIYAWNGQVDWKIGLLVSIGQAFGAYGAARFSVKSDRAGAWIQRILVVVLVVSIAHLLWSAFGR